MKERVVLITKDAVNIEYIPIYEGNRYNNKMPNLEELAAKGTVFTRYYTAAPSSAMSYISMFSGKNPYETDRRDYSPIQSKYYDIPNLFDKLHSEGYSCHILWNTSWYETCYLYSKCYGKNTQFHNIRISQPVGCHNKETANLTPNEELARETVATINNEIKSIYESNKGKLFLWIHLPHVLKGRHCYGSDMVMFDEVIGCLRKVFGDDSIFISADHGNMNGKRNKVSYGFDVYEPAIRIPLITPRIEGKSICDIPVSNTRIAEILDEKIPRDEFVYSDSAYYAQQSRKLAIIHGNFKYIYNKAVKTEELYDLRFDPTEQCNIVSKIISDPDRKIKYNLDQAYYYPHWEEAEKEREILRAEHKRIWKEGSKFENWTEKLRTDIKKVKILNKLLYGFVDLLRRRSIKKQK